jgi:protein-tyrosine kinase
MEKLQQALEKARQQRGLEEPRKTAGPLARSAAAAQADDLWAALPAFAPEVRTLKRNRIVTYDPGREAAALDMLRTKMLLHMRKYGWRRLAISSATAGCGKTTMLCNIALGMTRQPDVRTILFDLDLRNPSVGRTLGADPAHDVTDMLTGDVPFEEQAIRIRDNLAVCLANRRASDPTQYLMSTQAKEQLEEIERRYKPDLMLFDLPPLVIGGETTGFLNNVDCALIVARAERTTIAEIDECEREIAEHTNVMGVTLNQYRHDVETTYYYD